MNSPNGDDDVVFFPLSCTVVALTCHVARLADWGGVRRVGWLAQRTKSRVKTQNRNPEIRAQVGVLKSRLD